MRRLLLLSPLLILLFAAPVAAGGPTSALITDPAGGRAAGLYYSQPAYGKLQRLLDDAERLPERPAALGPAINVTWLLHDTEPWQLHQVHLRAAGGPVVATEGSWARPAQGAALRRLLTRVLGGPLPGAVPRAPSASTDATPSAATPTAAVSERVVTETAWWSLSGWRWLVPGLVVAAGGVLLVTRRRPGDREPRQVLVDAAP